MDRSASTQGMRCARGDDMTASAAPSRAEAIAAVLEACDGHFGRVIEEGPASPAWPTPAWKSEAGRILRQMRSAYPGTTWARGKQRAEVLCGNCFQSYNRHGGSRELADRLQIPVHERGLICPPPRP